MIEKIKDRTSADPQEAGIKPKGKKNMSALRAVGYSFVFVALCMAAFYAGYLYRIMTEVPSIMTVDSVINKENAATASKADFGIFWDAWRVVEEKHIDRNRLDPQKMVYGAIRGMIKSLDDPYSEFFNEEENQTFTEDIQGEFQGVGMEIGIKDNILTVVAPLKNTPAERAGLKAGDKIAFINDEPTLDLSIDEAVKKIRGPKGSEVKLTIVRDNEFSEPREFRVMRDVIVIPSVVSEVKEGDIGYIDIYHYPINVMAEFRKAANELAQSRINKLIIDVRNNPGGYLDAAIEMASYFLPAGEIVVTEDFGDDVQKKHVSLGTNNPLREAAIVILINEGSASASEIFAGALAEHGRAVLVGEKTFGKGSVQEMIPMPDNTSMKVTVAKWLTPSGRLVSDEGIEPNVAIEITEEDAKQQRDPQLEKAIEILKKVN